MTSFSDSVRVSTAVTCILSSLVGLGQAGPSAASANAQIAAAAAAQGWVPDGYYVPPYYPAPYGGWVDEWRQSYAKAKALVDSMTLAEKTNITAGTGIYMGERCAGNTGSALRVGIPQLCLNDSPAGVRHADNVTAFPDGITVGATFDKTLMYQRGVAIGKENRGKGVNVWLGPTVGPIGRKPKGGRNWEGFGADPALQAVGARETIKGVQEQGVIATIKHFIANEQEMYRMYNPFQYAYSSNLDDRTMHEVYAWPFAEGIHAGVGSVMMAYNAVNGTACTQHPYLMNALLKDEMGFQGFIMTDWLAHMSGVASAIAGLDMDMPGDVQIPFFGNSYWMYELSRSALNGSVPMDRINDAATRILAAWYKMGQDQGFPATNFDTNSGVTNEFVQVQADHDVVARQISQDAITLLKNDGGILPLSPSQHIKVFGTDAQKNPDGINSCTDRNCNKGTLGQGWGSGTVDYPYLDDPITAITAAANNVTFYNTDSFPSIGQVSASDVAIVFISSDAGENTYTVEGNHGDRDASGLYAWHNGDKLVQDAASKFSNVIVVIHTVGPLILENWIDLPSVKAVLIAHLPGQEAGTSLTNVLYGHSSPCGHLPYSITKQEADFPSSVTTLINSEFLNQPQDSYTEGLYIDYRWLNKNSTKPRYAFGHGLSYTNFTFTAASIKKITQLSSYPPARSAKSGIPNFSQAIPSPNEAVAPSGFNSIPRYIYSWLSQGDANGAVSDGKSGKYVYPDGYSTAQKPGPRSGGGEGGNPALWDIAYNLTVTVQNTGDDFAGKASVQAYLQFPDNIGYDTPIIQLRDFEKTEELAPGETTTVTLTLTRKDVSVWDVVAQDWKVPAVDGGYKVWIGDASDSLSIVCHADTLKCETGVTGPV
ncbi:fibronectin type III-like domain-containing protein [Trichoderma breve]|uniref:beta-glucosidase n=1 Tax=Trichoderma breve TaxID=2034170 RepID=A0A9W9EC51_9HYPO|nr:fibronectin type III-like domain-containing protein [Trichoderma breve]KAJ4863980.1 fibronectin type III-like domain-containing protein [Trichoderma breve]